MLHAAEKKGLRVPEASSFKAVPGQGVVVEYGDKTLLLGNRKLIASIMLIFARLSRASLDLRPKERRS